MSDCQDSVDGGRDSVNGPQRTPQGMGPKGQTISNVQPPRHGHAKFTDCIGMAEIITKVCKVPLTNVRFIGGISHTSSDFAA